MAIFVDTDLLCMRPLSGGRKQVYAVLIPEGGDDFVCLWMEIFDWLEKIADPIIASGKSLPFDYETYRILPC